MALPPEPSTSPSPSQNPWWAGYNPNRYTGDGGWHAPLINTPAYSFPDYSSLLQQYMAPFRALYESQIAALAQNIARQQEYAKKQESISESGLNQQHSVNDQNITQSLIARGLGDSGEPTYQHGLENKSYQNAKSSLSNALQNTLAGLQAQLDSAKFSGLMGLQQQQLGLIPMLQQMYQPTVDYPLRPTTPGVGAAPPPPAAPLNFSQYR